ncbi:MAG: DUF4416 family protein [Candidatus Omnitrophica bacterium]|nr:DUF4416 family protein [Candidatus Omnitrophota bacterium]
MLQLKYPVWVKYICGFIYSHQNIYNQAKQILIKKFGEIDYESNEIVFNFTNYYSKEMGELLWRRFISFKKLYDPAKLISFKLVCLKVEKKFAINNNRRVNIDPGYISSAKLILATTKDYYHRIYLGKGIYAEVTLHYQNNTFYDFPTTYPDYRTAEYKDIFLKIRAIYQQQIKNYKK